MGRKIPGKKHRRNTDAEKQIEKREAELRLKVNSAPKFLDEQEIPKRLKLISKLREDAKNQGNQKKEPKGPPKSDLLDSTKHMGFEMRLPGMKKDLRPIPAFKQNPGEKERHFFKRVNQEVTQFLKQKSYEAKYNVDLVQDQDTGKTKFVQREKDELQLEQEKIKAKKLEKKGIIVKSKEDKRKERRLKEKEKRMKKKRKEFKQNQINEDFDNTPEEVSFNEIVHAPPKLLGVKGLESNEARRPGKNKNLILLNRSNSADDKLNNENSSQKKKFVKPQNFKIKETKTKKKMKQKISLCKQQMLETDRMSIVEQYRAIKQKNMKQ